MKAPNPPTVTENIWGQYEIRWQQPSRKNAGAYENNGFLTYDKQNAQKLLAHHTCLRVLYPLLNYAKHQEHLISVMMLGNAQRSRPMGNLHRLTAALIKKEFLTPPELAQALALDILPVFITCMPGYNSRYLPLALDLEKLLNEFVQAYTPKDELSDQIPHNPAQRAVK